MASFSNLSLSKALKEKCRVNWKITNFSEIRGSKEALEAKISRFKMGSSINFPTKLKCYFTCDQVDGRMWINLNVALDKKPSGDVSELFATLQVEVNKGSVFRSDTSPMSNILTDSISFSPLLPQVYLPWEAEFCNYVNADGSLYLSLIVNLYRFKETSTRPWVFSLKDEFEQKCCEKLQQDFRKICKNPNTFSQALAMRKVISSDDKEFFVNPEVLTVRCPVLYSMVAEETSSVLKFSDISGKHLETLLHFVHTATLPVDDPTYELVYAAKKFALNDLSEYLEQRKKLSVGV